MKIKHFQLMVWWVSVFEVTNLCFVNTMHAFVGTKLAMIIKKIVFFAIFNSKVCFKNANI
jgi:hypothetical protein